MATDIISKKTRYEFREYFVGWTVRTIASEFDSADVRCDLDYVPRESGQRRSLVEQYYRTLDLAKPSDARKVLSVYESALSHASEHEPEIARRLCAFLQRDGFEYKNGRLLPTKAIAFQEIRGHAERLDGPLLRHQVDRIEAAVDSDPGLAIGTAKELVETCCKTILKEKGVEPENNLSVPKLVKATLRELHLLPDDIPDSAKAADTIKRLLSNLATITDGLAELRNHYGSGHGKDAAHKGLSPRHAKLAAGAATALAVFLFETHQQRDETSEGERG